MLQSTKYQNVLHSYVICAFPLLLLVKGTSISTSEKSYCDLKLRNSHHTYVSPVHLVTIYIRGRAELQKSTLSQAIVWFLKYFHYCYARSQKRGERILASKY